MTISNETVEKGHSLPRPPCPPSSSSDSLSWRRTPDRVLMCSVTTQHTPSYKSFQTWKKQPSKKSPVNRRRNVCGSCVVHKGHVLLVQQREVKKWGFPKGSREWQESKMLCMTRELLEETGLELNHYNHTFLGVQTFFESTIYFYEISDDVPSFITVCASDTREIADSQWIPLDDLKTLALNRVTNHIKRLVFKNWPTSDWKTTLIQLCQRKKKSTLELDTRNLPLTNAVQDKIPPLTVIPSTSLDNSTIFTIPQSATVVSPLLATH